MRWLQFASAPLLLSAQIVAAKADHQIGGAAAGGHRAAEDAGLDLSIDREAFFRAEEARGRGAPIGSFRAAQEVPYRVDWSRRAGRHWELNPVLLHRRQAGQPDRPDDDLSNKTLGIELRRRF